MTESKDTNQKATEPSQAVRYWAPRTPMPLAKMKALAVILAPGENLPTPSSLDDRMEGKLNRLCQQAGPRRAMELVTNLLPEGYQATVACPDPKDLPAWMMETDTMQALTGRVNWAEEKKPNQHPELSQQEIEEMLNEQTLQSLLELI